MEGKGMGWKEKGGKEKMGREGEVR